MTTPSERAEMTAEERERYGRIVWETGQTTFRLPFSRWDKQPECEHHENWAEPIRERCRVIGESAISAYLHDHPRDDLPPLNIVDNRQPCPNCPDKLDLEWDGRRTCPSCGYDDQGAGERGAAIERAARVVEHDLTDMTATSCPMPRFVALRNMLRDALAAPAPARGDGR